MAKPKIMADNIYNFPGYHISREGVLYSRYDKRGRLTNEYHPNKSYKRSNGYSQIVLKIRKENKLRRAYIHRLVAEAYIPNPLNLPCVCHRDNNRQNNSVDNLYWGSYKDNMQQAKSEGRLRKSGPLLIALVFSDLHIYDNPRRKNMLDNTLSVLDFLVKKASNNLVPLLFCRDLLHIPDKLPFELASKLIPKLRGYNQEPINMYAISGNHTLPSRSICPNPPKSWESILDNGKFLRCIDYKRVHIGNLYIHGIPYVDDNKGLNDYIKNINVQVGGKRSKHILMLHTSYPGAKDTDGREIEAQNAINPNLLNKFDLVLCGHIHKPQRLSKKVYMIGAPIQQRRTDKGCRMGYWELYSDFSMVFKELKGFPKFIDVESPEEVKEDGNYYTIIPKKSSEQVVTKHKITKRLSKKSLARRYMRAKGIKDNSKKNLLIDLLNKSEV